MKLSVDVLIITCTIVLSSAQSYLQDENNNILVEAQIKKYSKKFKPDWKDLDTRVAPEWYDKAKIGIFLHWGLYCVPGFRSEWFWLYWEGKDPNITKFMENNYPPKFTYQDFAPQFKAEFFDPNSFADLFSKAGAKYVVLTSKHHEGFTLFPSQRSFSWNSVDTGPHRDLVGDIATAVREKGIKFGVYHSLYEWFNPIYLSDKRKNFTVNQFVRNKLWPDLFQLVHDYEPSVIWVDGDWEANDTYWKSQEFLSWLYNESPVKDEVLVNDRWGKEIPCHHGDFYNCFDRYNPGILQNHKWENAFTLDRKSWGYRRNLEIDQVMTIGNLLKQVISTVSCGGNALINVGPTKEGTIIPIFQERLLQLGAWLKVNGEAIYETSPWMHQNDSYNNAVWYTCKKSNYNAQYPTAIPSVNEEVLSVYAMFLEWPKENNTLVIGDVSKYLRVGNWQISLLGNTKDKPLQWETHYSGRTVIYLPGQEKVDSKDAWSLKIEPISSYSFQ